MLVHARKLVVYDLIVCAALHRYTGSQGIYTHTVSYEKDTSCPVCSAGVLVEAAADATLQGVSGEWDAVLLGLLASTSLSFNWQYAVPLHHKTLPCCTGS